MHPFPANGRTIENDYFSWLVSFVSFNGVEKYKKLLMFLYMTPFDGGALDENREIDGTDFRYRFFTQFSISPPDRSPILELPCNMLEMMIALSVRCEEQLMSDPELGDRTSFWFWGMIKNLKLYCMTDDQYNVHYVKNAIDILKFKKYKPNGECGLFTTSAPVDMRTIEIWDQMGWYLNELAT